MNLAKQKLIIEYLLSSKDLYARCSGIVKSSYFDPELRKAVDFMMEYYQKYSALPKLDKFEAEFDLEFTTKEVKLDDISYISSECETFCKQSAIKEAIQTSMQEMAKGNFEKVTQSILESVKISLDRDVGIDLYDRPEERLKECVESLEYIPTNIRALDEKLGGGLVRQQLTLISANSGVGKSVLMSNIGDNIAVTGRHVLYISLELPEKMVYTRLASISTGENTKTWKQNIPSIAHKIERIKELGAASYVIKRLKNGSTANDIRSYLKQYELTFERTPDVIIVDYLDIMQPIGGIGNMSISEQDKAKSEQLYEIGVDYNAAMITASQQNRDGIKQASPDQAVIAGGFSKINIVDNYISIYMTPAMRLEGFMLLYFLKTRSSSAVGENIPLKFNRDNLQITDIDDEGKARSIISRLSKDSPKVQSGNGNNKFQKKKNEETQPKQQTSYATINGDIEGLPMPDDIYETTGSEEVEDDSDNLLSFMSSI